MCFGKKINELNEYVINKISENHNVTLQEILKIKKNLKLTGKDINKIFEKAFQKTKNFNMASVLVVLFIRSIRGINSPPFFWMTPYIPWNWVILLSRGEKKEKKKKRGRKKRKKEKRRSDFRPLKWPTNLEFISKIRVNEGTLTMAHSRLNGKDIWKFSKNGVRNWSWNLSCNWNDSNSIDMINQ